MRDAPAVTDEYKGIHTPVDLYDALSEIWCADTCAPREAAELDQGEQNTGPVFHHRFSGTGYFRRKGVRRTPSGRKLSLLQCSGRLPLRPTSEQFGDEVLVYENNPEQFGRCTLPKKKKSRDTSI